ncbi:hypothetical protein RN001_013709 [Aquatica leii]|uniref:Uncharacterized protein n=1 Tax=Aquatica leii TaxID=1421715 RepID=A0AAN7SE27_9COLE|nr:hypothetical protein RN001_013709 [Aquatica leii]
MARLTEREKIDILIIVGYGDKLRTHGQTLNEETRLDVLLEAEENPHHSTKQLALNNNVDYYFVMKLFKKEKYHPYKGQLIHELNEDDPDRKDPNFLINMLFSDAARCTPSGYFVSTRWSASSLWNQRPLIS